MVELIEEWWVDVKVFWFVLCCRASFFLNTSTTTRCSTSSYYLYVVMSGR